MDRRIEQLSLVEANDSAFYHQTVKNLQGGRPRTDYVVTLNQAKHLAQIEKTEVWKWEGTS